MMFQQQVYSLLSSNDEMALSFQPSIDKSYRVDPTNASSFLVDSRVGPSPQFTRVSSATEVGSDGFIRYANENRLFYSTTLVFGTGWAGVNTTSSLDGIGPYGYDAYIISETTATGIRTFASTGSPTGTNAFVTNTGQIFTGSVFIKKIVDSIDWIQLTFGVGGFGSGQFANFNIANGTIGNYTGAAPGTAPKIEEHPDGWYRCIFSAAAITGVTNSNAIIIGFTNNTDSTTRLPSYAGSTTESRAILATAAQTQIGEHVGEYILTTSSTRYAPRFDHDHATLESRGLFIEESRSNRIVQSEALNVTWTQTAVTVSANVETSPSGMLNADRIIETATTAAHGVAQNISYTAAPHTFSVYAKAGTRNWIRMGFGNAGTDNVWFNLETGEIGTIAAGFTATMLNAGNGWWRCCVTRTPTAGTLLTFIRLATGDNGIVSYLGDITGNIYLWGAQLETGYHASSYIPTTTSSIIRSADVCDINGDGFANMWNPIEGSLASTAVFYAPITLGTSQFFVDVNDGTLANRMRVFASNTTGLLTFYNNSSGTQDVDIAGELATTFIPEKISIGFKENDFIFYNNNKLAGSDTSANMIVSPTTLTIGDASAGTSRFYTNGTISSVTYYRRLLPYPKLQALSFAADTDADAYIMAIEAADGLPLEAPVAMAYQNFVIGCKKDGIWDAIKSCCILAGARTLQGALVPLKGTAPTNYAFIGDDYDRKTGLKGDGLTKYLDTNRNNTVDPQNNRHKSVYVTTAPTVNGGYIGAGFAYPGSDHIARVSTIFARSVNATVDTHTAPISSTGFLGIGRRLSSGFQFRAAGTTLSFSRVSETPYNQTNVVFGRDGVPQSDVRLAFYSIGTFIDLEKLDNRITQLVDEIQFGLNTGLMASNYDIDTVKYINAGYAAGGTLA